MPLYTWQCEDESCKHITEVVRPMENYKVPPDKCDKCNKTALIKVIEPMKQHQISLVWGGVAPFHNEAYSKTKPIR